MGDIAKCLGNVTMCVSGNVKDLGGGGGRELESVHKRVKKR